MSKISELGSITGANTRTEDLFVIVNLVQGDDGTKNITRKELVEAIQYEIFTRFTCTGGSISGTTMFENIMNDNVMNDNEFNRGSVNDTDINRADIDDSTFDNGVIQDSTANNLAITNSSFDDGTMDTVSGNNVSLVNSTIDDSTITDIVGSNVNLTDSDFRNSYFANGLLEDSGANNLTIGGSSFNNGTVNNTIITSSQFNSGSMADVDATDIRMSNSAITQSTFTDGAVNDSTANNLTITESLFQDGILLDSEATNLAIGSSTFANGELFDSTANNLTITNSDFSDGTGNNNVFTNTIVDNGEVTDSVISNTSFQGTMDNVVATDLTITSSTASNTGINQSTFDNGAITDSTFEDGVIERSELVDFDMELENVFEPRIDENSWFALKNAKTGETERITYRQFFDEISKTTSKALKVHVEASSGDDRNPGTLLQPVRTLERAAELALEKAGGVYNRNAVNNAVHISCGPGTYYTKGGVALPDDCSLTSTSGQYATVIEALPGYEFNNAILVGSGCYVQGFSYLNWKVDNFDFPEGGFAIAYRPGAKMLRSPYIRDSSQLSNFLRADVEPPLQPFNTKGTIADLGREIFMEPGHSGLFVEGDEIVFGSGATGYVSWDQDVLSDNRIYVRNLKGDINVGDTIVSESGGTGNIAVIGIDDFPNPLVGRGGGCVLADRRVLDPDSLYTYVLTFGFTPRTQNGIGYVARDGAGVNGIGSLSIFTRCAFYALNGGQVTLNNSGTQFGDISMRAKGTTTFYAPKDPGGNLIANTAFADLILENANNIIEDMVSYLTTPVADGGLGYQGYDSEKCYRDTGIVIDKISADVQTGSNYWGRLSGITYRSPISYVVPGEQLEETAGANRYLQGRIETIFGNANTEILERANTSMDELLNILENGEEYASDIIWTDTGNTQMTAARELIQDNREMIADKLIDWIEDNDQFFAYNSVTCRRDTQEYILPAVKNDMLLDTNYNSVTAGNAYYMNTAAKVVGQQRNETVAAYKTLKERTNEIIDEFSYEGSFRADSAFDNIIDALEEKSKTYTPTFATYDPISGIFEVTIGKHRIEEGEEVILAPDSFTFECGNPREEILHPRAGDPAYQKPLRVIDRTETTIVLQVGNANGYTGVHYFVSAEKNAVRLATEAYTPIDSTYDAVTGITTVEFADEHFIEVGDLIEIAPNGITYSCANTATGQIIEISHPRPSDPLFKHPTPVLERTAKTITFNSGDAGGYTGIHSFVRAVNFAISHIETGIRFSDNAAISVDRRNARKQLQANKKYIQDYMFGWIDYNYFNYDADKCERDVTKYILPAVQRDILLGTNFNAVQTGVGYHAATASRVIGDQLPETVGAVTELRDTVGRMTSDSYTPTDASYNANTGVTVLTIGNHDIEVGDRIILETESITFECANTILGANVEITHPRTTDPLFETPVTVTAVTANSITFNSGDANGYTGAHYFVSANDNSVKKLIHDDLAATVSNYSFNEIIDIMKGSGKSFTPTNADYSPTTGLMEITIGGHALTTQDQVILAPESFTFECGANNTIISHPRTTDPAYKEPLDIISVTGTTIVVDVGDANGYTGVHTFVSAQDDAVTIYNKVRKTTFTPITASYNANTGIMVATIGYHNMRPGSYVEIAPESITFSCFDAVANTNVEISHPRPTDPFYNSPIRVQEVTDVSITLDVGDANGYTGVHTFVRAKEDCIRDDVVSFTDPAEYDQFFTPTDATYNANTGIFTVTFGSNHGMVAGDRVELLPGSFVLSCANTVANTVVEFAHPRPSDPFYREPIVIDSVTPTTITMNVGEISGGYSEPHTFVRAADNAVALLHGSVNEIAARDQLQANRDFLASEVVSYLANTYFIYDSSKCSRDTGYIIDAVKRDVLTGSNYNAVFNGLAYRSGTLGADTVVEDQLTETLGAYAWLKTEVGVRLSGSAQARSNAAFDEIIDIITNGQGAANLITFGDSYVSNDALNTRGIIHSNKVFLQNEITAWITENYPGLTYDSAKCERDVGYLVDSASFDIQHGSNVASINNARIYFENAVSVLPEDQQRITAEAFAHIASVAKKLAGNETVTPTTGNSQSPAVWIDVEWTPVDADYDPVTGRMEIDLGNTHSFSVGDFIDIATESFTFECGSPAIEIVHPRRTDPAYETPLRIIAKTSNTIIVNVGNAGGYTEPHTFVSAAANAVSKHFNPLLTQRVEDLINIISQCVLEDGLDRLPPPVEPNDIGSPFYESGAIGTIVGGGKPVGVSGGIEGEQAGLLSYGIQPVEQYAIKPTQFYPFMFGVGKSGYDEQYQAAAQLINGLTEKLQTEIVEYINDTYNGVGFAEAKCLRDTGYLVDAISEDIQYGGNEATIRAAEAYFINSINLLPQNQYDPTRDAFTHLAAKAEEICLETTVEPHFGDSFTPTDATYDPITGMMEVTISAHDLSVGEFVWFDEESITFECGSPAVQISHPRSTDPFFEKPVKISQTTATTITVFVGDAGGYSNTHTFVSADADAVKHVTGNTIAQNKAGVPTDATTAARVETLMLTIANLVDDRTNENIPAISGAPSYTPLRTFARQAIQANRRFLQEEVVAFLNDRFFTYDGDKCFRDTGYLIDAARNDMATASNYNSIYNGLCYRSGTVGSNNVVEDQLSETVGGIRYVQQRLTAAVDDENPNDRIDDSFDKIVEIMTDAPTANTTIVFGAESISADGLNGRINLQANRAFMQAEATAYIAQTYPSLVYDVAKCERDIGYLVDAVSYDTQHGGNQATVNVARMYFENGNSTLPADQRTQTAAVFTHIAAVAERLVQLLPVTPTTGNLLSPVTTGLANAGAVVGAAIEASMQIVADVITDNDLDDLPTITHPAGYGTEFIAAAVVMDGRKETLQSAVLSYIANNYNGLAYNEEKCRRDTGYLVDAISHDIQYGGNAGMVNAARIYFENAVNVLPRDQREPTRRAFTHLGDTIETIIQRLDVTPTLQRIKSFNPTNATYDPFTGVFTATIGSHNLSVGDAIIMSPESFTFECGTPAYEISHPRSSDPFFNKPVEITAITTTTITFQVGTSNGYTGAHTFVSAKNGAITHVIGNIVQQDKRFLPAVYPERDDIAGYCKNLAMIVANIVDDADDSQIPTLIDPDTSWVPNNLIASKEAIEDISPELADGVISYVSREWNGLSFPRAKCRRDIGYIVDAISHDVQYETNYATRINAQIYFENGVSVLPLETRRQTAEVYEEMGILMSNIIQEIDTSNVAFPIDSEQDFTGTPSSSAVGSEAQGLVQIIEDCIRRDTTSYIPALVEPNTSWVDADIVTASQQIERNITSLADAIINFINTEFNVLDYNKSKCRRDTGYLIDAFSYDLNYGGNTASRWNAEFYFWNNVYRIPEDQRLATALSYRELGRICSQIVEGKYPGQIIKGELGSPVEAEKVQVLADMFFKTQKYKDTKELDVFDDIDLDWIEKPFTDAYAVLLAKRGPLQYDVVRYVNATYKFIDLPLTRRDAGNLLTVITNDLRFTNPLNGTEGSTKATRTFTQSLFDNKGQHVFPVFNPTTPGLRFIGTVSDIGDLPAINTVKPNNAYIVSSDASTNFYVGNIYYSDGTQWVNDGANNTDLLYAFYATWDRMKDFINANYTPDLVHENMVNLLFEDCLKDNVLRPETLTFGSLVESIAHQFNGGAAGVNRNALPLNFRNLGPATSAIASVLSEDGGRVRWSGADELNNQYFARGLRINGRTGRIEGRPFTSSVRKLARRASNSRAVV